MLAAVKLALHAGEGTSKTARKRIDRAVVKGVAEALGNTPAVSRRAYIDPRVFDRFHSGATITDALPERSSNGEFAKLRESDRERIERAVVELLS